MVLFLACTYEYMYACKKNSPENRHANGSLYTHTHTHTHTDTHRYISLYIIYTNIYSPITCLHQR